MRLFDWFFPEQAQAAHLRRVADAQAFSQRRQIYDEMARTRRHAEIDARLESLDEQIGFLTLMLEAIIRKTEEKGIMTRDELKTLMKSIDLEDGRADGKFIPKR